MNGIEIAHQLMDENKLRHNLNELSKLIARKPTQYTPKHAIAFRESFIHYTNTRTINLISASCDMLTENGWPYPSFLARESQKNMAGKMAVGYFLLGVFKHDGFFNSLKLIMRKPKESQKFDREDFYKKIDVVMLLIFDHFKKKIFNCWREHAAFRDKITIINQIQTCYDKKLWVACISTAFPILDYLIRDYFKTRRLDKDINQLLRVFRNAGFTSSKFKPGFDGYRNSDKTMTVSDFIEQDLRLIGIGLSSFVDTASIYYQYYRKDFMAPESEYPLNRHAVIHSASSDFNTKENAVKLLTFIDLTLELEFVFRILLKEE